VTADSPEGPVALVANSFASVSLDPPLVLWSPAKASNRFSHFAKADKFAIHILCADQRDVCAAVVRSKFAVRDFSSNTNADSVPIIDEALAVFECNLAATHDAGDHVIVVGQVTKAHQEAGDPLVFQGGNYGRFRQD
jgi:flavin reductase (DIM6/NTAB) family NADH-FMN oxidoreductase RutF